MHIVLTFSQMSVRCRHMGTRAYIAPKELTPEQVRCGLSPAYLDELVNLGLDRQRVARLVGADSTLRRRRKAGARLNPGESDRLARVMRIVRRAIEVFGNQEKAVAWLTRTSRHSTRGQAPIDMLDTDPGAQWVSRRLDQIAYGLAA